MEKRYNSVVISCPEIVDGGTYTVEMGDNSTEVTMDGLIYGSGFEMGHGGGDFGGKRGKNEAMPEMDGMEKPSEMPEMDGMEMPSEMPEMDGKDMPNDKNMKRPDDGGKDETVTGGGREIPIEGNSDNTKKE
jgi:hypothetical protein